MAAAAAAAHVTNHSKLLLQRLHEQREMDFLCDITVVVRDVEFRAHRNVLAAFSNYFSAQADEGRSVITLDPEKVSRYALEKLLEFIYTGRMNLSSTRQAAVRRAATYLGMAEAVKYLEECYQSSDVSEALQPEAEKEAGLGGDSPGSAGSPTSPVPLSISVTGQEDGNVSRDEESGGNVRVEEAERSDEDYAPKTMKTVGTGLIRKRGRPPKSVSSAQAGQGNLCEDKSEGKKRGRPPRTPKDVSVEQVSPESSSEDAAKPPGRKRGRPAKTPQTGSEEQTLEPNLSDETPKPQGKRRGRPPKTPKSLSTEEAEPCSSTDGAAKTQEDGGNQRDGTENEGMNADDSDASMKETGDTSADWSPSQEESPAKRGRLSSDDSGRGRSRGGERGRGRRRQRMGYDGEDSSGTGADDYEEEEEGEIGADSEAGDEPRSCGDCHKQFKDLSSLRRHGKIHEGVKPFTCIFCSKTFRQATQLKTHLRIHTGEKPFSCSDCEKCFAQKCQLVAHRRMYHGEEKPYTCDRCGYKFATSSNYKIHVRLHSGEKPYVCDICGQAFAQSSTLTYHKRRHTGEKPYQCDLCGMSFSVSSSLIAHARKHTGETPYKCPKPQCEASYVTSSELKKHMRRLHPEGSSSVQCLLCGNRFSSVKNMIKHQEKAHADEMRQHKERARAVVLLASSHPVAFVQSKLTHDKVLVAMPEGGEPPNPDPATPNPKAMAVDAGGAAASMSPVSSDIQDFKVEPLHTSISGSDQVTFEADQEQTINSDTLHALVEQLRPPASPAQSLEQIVIIRTVDSPEHNPPQQ